MRSRHGIQIVRRHAFTLLELVIVVVILVIISAVAVPKMSRAATTPAELELIEDLSMLRSAVSRYRADHHGSPPAGDTIWRQLTRCSDEHGNMIPVPCRPGDSMHIDGPYLRTIPGLPVGRMFRGGQLIGIGNPGTAVAPPGGYPVGTCAVVGWAYDAETGLIQANTREVDGSGTDYSAY